MASSRTGHTTTKPAAELDGELQPATPASPDLVCWFWAAFPPSSRGRLHTALIAQRLGVTQRTVQRWVKNPKRYPLNRQQELIVIRRAILRGRGHYLWPPADEVTVRRSAAALAHAQAALTNLAELGPSRRDRETGVNESHEIYLVHYPRAHVYGLVATRQVKHVRRAERNGADVLQSITVPNLHAATITKELILAATGDARCIAPRTLVPTGRTETWRETHGPIDLVRFVENGKSL